MLTILFDDIIAEMEAIKKLSLIVTELFLRERKLNILFVFISQSYFKVPKRLHTAHYLIVKIPNKRELQEVTWNHLSDNEFKVVMKLYKDCAKESFTFLVNDMTLSSNNPLKFKKNLL